MLTERSVTVFAQLGRTYRAFSAAFEAHVGMPMPRWRILFALHQEGAGSLSQKRLVETLRIDPGALTRQLKMLDALGWVSRSTDARDNRVTNVALTQAGLDVIEANLPRRQAFFDAALQNLPDSAYLALTEGLPLLENGIQKIMQELPTPDPAV